MLEKIINKDTLIEQAKILKKKKFKPGFDGMSAETAVSWLWVNGDRFCNDILTGDYRPMPAIGFKTAKMNGGYRQLARLTALDTILQYTLNSTLSHIVDAKFSDSSFAYRSGRGVSAALERYV